LLELALLEEKQPRAKKPLPPNALPAPSILKEQPPPAVVPVMKKETPVVRQKPAHTESSPELAVEAKPDPDLAFIESRHRKAMTEEPLAVRLKKLMKVPEIALDKKEAKAAQNLLAKAKTKGKDDAQERFLVEVVANRPDLAGLPMVLGNTTPTDCSAAELEEYSQLLRETYRKAKGKSR